MKKKQVINYLKDHKWELALAGGTILCAVGTVLGIRTLSNTNMTPAKAARILSKGEEFWASGSVDTVNANVDLSELVITCRDGGKIKPKYLMVFGDRV